MNEAEQICDWHYFLALWRVVNGLQEPVFPWGVERKLKLGVLDENRYLKELIIFKLPPDYINESIKIFSLY